MTVLNDDLKFRIEKHIRERFRVKAKALGLKESELLRNMVLAVIDEEAGDTIAVPDGGSVEPVKITLSLPGFLLSAAKQRASGKGMVLSRWLSSLVQSNLTNKPVMSENEVLLLRANIRELAAIGRNINQIAKSLNENFYETERIRIEKLDALRIAIAANQDAVRALVRASQSSWEAE